MESEYHYRFLILDFGHPMNINTTENVINSLENALALGSAFPRTTKEIHIGVSILNSDFAIIQSESTLYKNYHFIIKNLEGLVKTLSTNSRITVQEYKYLLSKSIEAILREFQNFKKRDTRSLAQIAVITKKNAAVLADILKDVTNKLRKINPHIHAVEKYKVVQITSEDQEEIHDDPGKNSLIHCTSCLDSIQVLNCFFKDWLLNPQQQLRILLSKYPDFWVECDMDDCIINPISLMLEGKFHLFNEFSFTASKDTSKPTYLEVINRLPVGGLCPTLVFGIPRRIYATHSRTLSATESQNNSKIFKELCRELNQTRQGLLAKSVLPTEKGRLSAFHFLASDGDLLLLNDISPDELSLPKLNKSSQPGFCEDPHAASVIKDCFKKIEYMDGYTAKNFSSGIFEHLRHYLAQVGQHKNMPEKFVPSFKITGEESMRKENSKTLPETCHTDGRSVSGASKTKKKRQKTNSKVQLKNVHPALLTPNVVEKYRRIQSTAFNLPELNLNFNADQK